MNEHEGLFRLAPSQAAAVAFASYDLEINSTELVERLDANQSTLIVPGDHFGLDHHVRISFGLEPDYLREGLRRIATELEAIRAMSSAG